MNLKVVWTNRFKKDYKAAMKQGQNMDLLDETIRKLSKGESLPPDFMDHPLKGTWKDFRECHILPDWLLIYAIQQDRLVLTLARTGSHSNLFDK